MWFFPAFSSRHWLISHEEKGQLVSPAITDGSRRLVSNGSLAVALPVENSFVVRKTGNGKNETQKWFFGILEILEFSNMGYNQHQPTLTNTNQH